MSVSVEVLPDAGAPQVGITVTGLPSGTPSVVTVEKSVDGTTWETVRGALRESVTGASFFRDFVPPLNIEATYRLVTAAVVTGPTSATIVVPSETAWLQDPLNPRAAVPIRALGMGTGLALLAPSAASLLRAQVVDVVQVQGARTPVASVGPRQAPSQVPLLVRAAAAAQGALVKELRDLLDGAGVLVLRGLHAASGLDPVAHIVAGDVTEVATPLGVRNDWQLVVTQVRPPSPRISVPWWTYDQVNALWEGFAYDQVVAARPGETYLDWLRDPSPSASSALAARASEV
jgi:hypothetical protein